MNTPKIIRVLIADASKSFRETVAGILKNSQTVVYQASHELELLQQVKVHKPDVIVYDFLFAAKRFEIITNSIRAISPASRLLVLSFELDPDLAEFCLSCGADGFFDKSISDGDVINEAVKKVSSGEKVVLILKSDL